MAKMEITDSIDAAVKQAFDEVNCPKNEKKNQTSTSNSSKNGDKPQEVAEKQAKEGEKAAAGTTA